MIFTFRAIEPMAPKFIFPGRIARFYFYFFHLVLRAAPRLAGEPPANLKRYFIRFNCLAFFSRNLIDSL